MSILSPLKMNNLGTTARGETTSST
uniref:Uncharacterized protein n=1 Tax=Anguilla anguilla TaxID=7936 RepID=A0A0E9W4M0_ANGAN